MSKTGKIIRIISNLYTVESENKIYECRARGKFRNDKVTPLVGDFVLFDEQESYILEIEKRTNCLSRPMIANVDNALIITSVKKPDLSLNLLDKQLLCITDKGITPIICLTKCDLLNREEKKYSKKVIKYYKSIGYLVITNKQIFKLKRLIKNKTVVLTGQTGAGKSTLLNKLDRTLNLNTSPISEALGRGVHTTRHVELFKIGHAFLADTPGFSSLDLNMNKEDLRDLYPEFRDLHCKFDNCMHTGEKGCNLKSKLENNEFLQMRYDNYLKFRGELK